MLIHPELNHFSPYVIESIEIMSRYRSDSRNDITD